MLKNLTTILALLMFATSANASLIVFNAEFEISETTGVFSPELIGNTYSATITVDDTCGSNLDFVCSNMNAVLDFMFEGIDVGTNAGWDTIVISAMSDFFEGDSNPFTYIDPVYDDVIFDFTNNDGTSFGASTNDPDDITWSYFDATGSGVNGFFGITSRATIPEPSTIAIFVFGMMGLCLRRFKTK